MDPPVPFCPGFFLYMIKKRKVKESEELVADGKMAEDIIEENQKHINEAGPSSFKTLTSGESKRMPGSTKESSNKMFNNSIEVERKAPEGFYIAHPRNNKRTAHFKDVHSRKLSELLEAFHMFDFDRDGIINQNDLRKTFASLCIDIEDEDIGQMLLEGMNPLNFDSFVILLGYKTLDLDPEEVLLDAFSNWDERQEGLISYESLTITLSKWTNSGPTDLDDRTQEFPHSPLKQHIMAWGDKFREDEAIAALADAPIVINKTKEKMIDYIQFSEDLCGLRKMMQRKTGDGN